MKSSNILNRGNTPVGQVQIKLKFKDFENMQLKLVNEFSKSNELIQKQKSENAIDKTIEDRIIVLLNVIKTHSGGNQRFFTMIDKIKKNIGWVDQDPKKEELDDSQVMKGGSQSSNVKIQANVVNDNNFQENSQKNTSAAQQILSNNGSNNNNGWTFRQANVSEQQPNQIQQQQIQAQEAAYNKSLQALQAMERKLDQRFEQLASLINSQSNSQRLPHQPQLSQNQNGSSMNLDTIHEKLDALQTLQKKLLEQQDGFYNDRLSSQAPNRQGDHRDSVISSVFSVDRLGHAVSDSTQLHNVIGQYNQPKDISEDFSVFLVPKNSNSNSLIPQNQRASMNIPVTNVINHYDEAENLSQRSLNPPISQQFTQASTQLQQNQANSNSSMQTIPQNQYGQQQRSNTVSGNTSNRQNFFDKLQDNDGLNSQSEVQNNKHDNKLGSLSYQGQEELKQQQQHPIYNNQNPSQIQFEEEKKDSQSRTQSFATSNSAGSILTQQQQQQQQQNAVQSQDNFVKFKPGQKQLALFRNQEGKIIVGQNSPKTLVFNDKIEFLSEINLQSDLVSIYPYDEKILCGLSNNEIRFLDELTLQQDDIVIKTKSVVQKFEIIPGAYENFLLLCEQDGYLELLNMDTMEIDFTYQHSSKLSIQDAAKIQSKDPKNNDFALCMAKLENGKYVDGQLTFIRINLDVPKNKIIELNDETQFQNKAVFCIQQVSQNTFIVCIIDDNFKLYNRQTQSITDIPNPSGSINYNCLQKILDFGPECPLLIYKDSRSIGIIDCKALQAQKIIDATYKRCGNLYAMEQYYDDYDKLNLVTLLYDGQSNERAIKNYELQIK